jgi:hypothetical protein
MMENRWENPAEFCPFSKESEANRRYSSGWMLFPAARHAQRADSSLRERMVDPENQREAAKRKDKRKWHEVKFLFPVQNVNSSRVSLS